MRFAVLAVCLIFPSLFAADVASTGTSFNDVLDITSRGGILGFVLLVLWTGRKGVWVWGSAAEARVQTEKDRANHAEQRAELLEAKLDETRKINEDRIERIIPAMSESTHANIEARSEMQRLITEVTALKEAAALAMEVRSDSP